MITKKQLAIQLSKLCGFEKPIVKLEQYTTDPEIAATVLWDAMMKGDILNKEVADLGAGTGVLGIGALLLGATHVYFVEKDPAAVLILQQNLHTLRNKNYSVINMDVTSFTTPVHTVFQNPPFGTKLHHADKPFLEVACSVAEVVYSFHKTATDVFVRALAEDYGFTVAEVYKFLFPLRQTYLHQKKRRELIEVSCYKLVKVH